MSLITPADLLTPHGARELAQLASPEGHAVLEAALLEATLRGTDRSAWSAEELALADQAAETIGLACAFANALLGRIGAGRTLSDTEQTLLSGYARDVARYQLYDDAKLPEEHPVRLRYRDAVRFVERVASGLESLGQTVLGSAGSPASVAPTRTFSADSLSGWCA